MAGSARLISGEVGRLEAAKGTPDQGQSPQHRTLLYRSRAKASFARMPQF
jgi:hypothetical protein